MVFILAALVISALILLFSRYAYGIAFHSPMGKRYAPDDPIKGEQYVDCLDNLHRISHIMERYTFEPITIRSFDGTALFGRYYHMKDGAPIEILFHGYRSHAFRDCSGGHALSRKMGLNTLVIDQRAHGDSGGTAISFGIRERKDCLCWVNYLCERFGRDVPIILSGLSMGAATVLMASELELPENVVCIIADSPYSSPADIIEKVCRDEHYPPNLCRPFMRLGAFVFGGFRLTESTAVSAVKKAKVPILLIHGEADRFVPCDMSREIAKNCASRMELHTFPDAGHGLCYMTDPRRYERVVYDFLMTIPSVAKGIDPAFEKQIQR